ncbi:DUF3050 domain-containing protein [Brevibacillus dissolubilis]|uniref:DUF3050 domain-containing protein n=1 Tax=Brevibacillus dissolubilis TaxID=1844116 RepID=UPI001116C474|nr:DUF3050 domain-containing protein [Brevibacillus dissolubilis]
MSTVTMTNITAIRDQLLQHPVYQKMDNPENVKVFMEHHVFAVWDFMSLLKRLQIDLTCTTVPWMPVKNAHYARFINEIVLGEETDEDGQGGFASHFELYLQAMAEVGADTGRINRFLQAIESGAAPLDALRQAEVPETVYQFVSHTLDLAQKGGTHEVCASFFFGREDLIPDMFQVLVDELTRRGQSADRLVYYLKRHIELDGDEHGPLAEKLLSSLCGDDAQRLSEAERTATNSLKARITLWDGVLAAIEGR